MRDSSKQAITASAELDSIADLNGEDFDRAFVVLSGGVTLPSAGLLAMKMGYEIVIAKRRHEARVILRSMPRPPIMRRQMNAVRAMANIESLYTQWIVGNTPLGLCTKAMLIDAGNRDRIIAEGNLRNLAFHHGLAEAMPDGDGLVKDVLDINIAHEIRARAFLDTAA